MCSCSCDVLPGCCECVEAECTNNTHCEGDAVCEDVFSSGAGVHLLCVPLACEGSTFEEISLQTDREAMAFGGEACVSSLTLFDTTLIDLSEFSTLEYIHYWFDLGFDTSLTSLAGLEALRHVGTLQIEENSGLTNVDALAGLEQIIDGGAIRNNSNLDRAVIDAALAGIDGAELLMICGNLNDVPC